MSAQAEFGEARTDEPEIEKRGRRARTAVEHEGHRPVRRVGGFHHVGRVEHRGRTLAGLIEQRERAGGRRIGKFAAGRIDAVLADGVGGQERKHAGSVFLLPAGPALTALLLATPGPAGVLLRQRGGAEPQKRAGDERHDGKFTAKMDHDCFLKTFARRPPPAVAKRVLASE